MVKHCAYPFCPNKQLKKEDPYNHIQFHSFPLKRPEILESWVEAVGKGEDWKPGRSSRLCSAHFTPDCFKKTSGMRKLLAFHAVPTVFQRQTSAITRRKRKKRESHEKVDENCLIETPEVEMPQTEVSQLGVLPFPRPSRFQTLKLQYDRKLKEARRNNRILRLRIRRRDRRIEELKKRLISLKATLKDSVSSDIGKRLEGFTKELLEHSARNAQTKRTGIRYSPSLREFALTLYLHSPRAYIYVRSLLRLLPNPSLVKKWISNFNRAPPEIHPHEVVVSSGDILTTDIGTTEELIIDDIDSFIVIEDPDEIQSCIAGVTDHTPSTDAIDHIPVVVAHHIQIH